MWPGEVHDFLCPEPGCSGRLVLKESKYGLFYGCTMWPQTRCPGAHGAHPDGTPLGIPASKETKQYRMKAHDAFDRLWKQPTKVTDRAGAYKWMRAVMHLTEEEAHIGRFTIEQCEELCRHVKDRPPSKKLPLTEAQQKKRAEKRRRYRERKRARKEQLKHKIQKQLDELKERKL